MTITEINSWIKCLIKTNSVEKTWAQRNKIAAGPFMPLIVYFWQPNGTTNRHILKLNYGQSTIWSVNQMLSQVSCAVGKLVFLRGTGDPGGNAAPLTMPPSSGTLRRISREGFASGLRSGGCIHLRAAAVW